MNQKELLYSVWKENKKSFLVLHIISVLIGLLLVAGGIIEKSLFLIGFGAILSIILFFVLYGLSQSYIKVNTHTFIKSKFFGKPIKINLHELQSIQQTKQLFQHRGNAIYVDAIVFHFKDSRDALTISLNWGTVLEHNIKQETLDIINFMNQIIKDFD